MPVDAWVHDLSPIAVKLGPFAVRWYGLSYAAGFLIAWILLRWLARRGAALVPADRAGDFVVTLAIGAVVGGRLGYVIVYRPSLLLDFSSGFPWWGLLRINEGGMASHGGMVGLVLASYLVARSIRKSRASAGGAEAPNPPAPPDGLSIRGRMLHVLDLAAILSPFGLLLGRLANFVNGELLGRIVAQPGEPAPWWAVRYPQEVLTEHDAQVERSDTQWDQLWEAVEPYAREGDRSIFDAYERALVALQSGSAELAEKLAPVLSARHPSQLYQAIAEGVVLGAVLWWVWRRPRLPGVASSAFLITYGALRIVTEIWRLPDGHLETPTLLGLSRGQWLSVLMVLAGLGMLAIVTRRGGPRLGGWRSPSSAN